MSLPERSPNWRYAEYLKSPAWAELRRAVTIRAGGRCEVEPCAKDMAHVHHLRYPKVLGEEALTDLIAVCIDHHDLLHGVFPMNLPVVAGEIRRFPTPGGRELVATVHDGHPFASDDAWFTAINVPRHMRKYFSGRLEIGAMEWQKGNPGSLVCGVYNGSKVYSWHIPMYALQNWFPNHQRGGFIGSDNGERQAEQRFAEDYWKVLQWIGDLSSKDIALRLRGATPMSGQLPEALSQAIATLATLQKQTTAVTDDHDRRIGVVEHIVTLSADEGIIATEACSELSVDANQITRGRLTLAQDAGNRLRSEAADRLGEKLTRFPNSSLTTQVAVWRRRDLYRVIGEILGRDFLYRIR